MTPVHGPIPERAFWHGSEEDLRALISAAGAGRVYLWNDAPTVIPAGDARHFSRGVRMTATGARRYAFGRWYQEFGVSPAALRLALEAGEVIFRPPQPEPEPDREALPPVRPRPSKAA